MFYQLYLLGGRDTGEITLERIRKAGFAGLFVTIDTAVAGMRERDFRNGMKELISGSIADATTFRCLATLCKISYKPRAMPRSPEHIDKPEPRGQVIAAVLAIVAIYLALPSHLVVGPIWLLPTVIVVLPGEYLMALVSRLSKICRTFTSSAHTQRSFFPS